MDKNINKLNINDHYIHMKEPFIHIKDNDGTDKTIKNFIYLQIYEIKNIILSDTNENKLLINDLMSQYTFSYINISIIHLNEEKENLFNIVINDQLFSTIFIIELTGIKYYDHDIYLEFLDMDKRIIGYCNIEIKSIILNFTEEKLINKAMDKWFLIEGIHSGEIRLRTYYESDTDLTKQINHTKMMNEINDNNWFDNKINSYYNNLTLNNPLKINHHQTLFHDRYGFIIPPSSYISWNHLHSYDNCREERRIKAWNHFLNNNFLYSDMTQLTKNDTFRRLIFGGIPRHRRQNIYINLSGAFKKKEEFPQDYYFNLVALMPTRLDVKISEQIDLDINRTFGHSKTKMNSGEGKEVLRRILSAYSIRNTKMGYCQGLNFIVGFFCIIMEEEEVFWLLAVICEDLFPGYYVPSMFETQTDMLVLKDLIANDLMDLDEHVTSIGLPLELLGSQWLLCLFTTTFPSETVFRIFDCIFLEGPHFIFAVILAHLRYRKKELLQCNDFQSMINYLRDAETTFYDSDLIISLVGKELNSIPFKRIEEMREMHRTTVNNQIEKANRIRSLNKQLAIVQHLPAFSTYAAEMIRFFHRRAELASRSDVAFILTLLCHGLVWLAEHSRIVTKRKK